MAQYTEMDSDSMWQAIPNSIESTQFLTTILRTITNMTIDNKTLKTYYMTLLRSCQDGNDILSMLDMISNEHNMMQTQDTSI